MIYLAPIISLLSLLAPPPEPCLIDLHFDPVCGGCAVQTNWTTDGETAGSGSWTENMGDHEDGTCRVDEHDDCVQNSGCTFSGWLEGSGPYRRMEVRRVLASGKYGILKKSSSEEIEYTLGGQIPYQGQCGHSALIEIWGEGYVHPIGWVWDRVGMFSYGCFRCKWSDEYELPLIAPDVIDFQKTGL